MRYAAFVTLAIAALTDWRWRRIPNPLLLAALPIAVVGAFMAGGARAAAGMVLAGATYFLLFAVAALRGWVGFGDAKLLGVLAIFLGWVETLYVLTYACVLGLIWAICYLAWHRKLQILLPGRAAEGGAPHRERFSLPFAPFLFLGAGLSALWM